MSDELKRKFQNKCIGLTDDHRDYIYGTDWKGYAKALEKAEKENKTIRDAFVEQIHFLLELDRANIKDKSMAIYKWITK